MPGEDIPPLKPSDLGIGRLFGRVRDAVIVADAASGRIVLWNPAAETIFGYSAAEAVGLPVQALVPEYPQSRLRAQLAAYRATGHPPAIDADVALDLPALRKTGEEIAIEMTLSLIDDAPVAGPFVLAIVRDITERGRAREERAQLIREQLARAEAEASQQRLAFLAEAGTALALSLDYETTLQRVAQLAISSLADWCIIDILDEDQTVRRFAIAHVDPSKHEVIHELESRYPLDLRSEHPRAQVLRTGASVLLPEVTDAHFQAVARDAQHRRLLRQLGARSSLLRPLLVQGGSLGALGLGCAQP